MKVKVKYYLKKREKAMKGHLVKYNYIGIIFLDERNELPQISEMHE